MTERTLQDLLDDDTIDTMSITDPPVAEILSTGGGGWTRVRLSMAEVAGDTTVPLLQTVMNHRPPGGQKDGDRMTEPPVPAQLPETSLSTNDDDGQGGEPR